jgi:hypothetical protein
MGETEINVFGDEEIFSKVEKIMSDLRKNQKLQELSEQNGLSVKNTAKLTDEAINNIAVTIVALLLAKRQHDPRYSMLVKAGMQKRSLKTEIVNAYKNQANGMITKYKAAKL